MPRLHTLRLSFGSSQKPSELEKVSTTEILPPKSFQTLRRLELEVQFGESGWSELLHVWHTPLVSNLTHVKVNSSGHIGSSLEQIIQFLTTIATHSPKVHHLEINDGGKDPEEESLQLPLALLSHLEGLRLRVFGIQRPITSTNELSKLSTIGNLWPDLEKLYLESTIVELRASELLHLSTCLPKLRHLQARLPWGKPSHSPLRDNMQHLVPPLNEQNSDRPILDIIDFHPATGGSSYQWDDIEFLARVLVAISSDLRLGPGTHGYLRQRVAYYTDVKKDGSS